MSKNNTKPDELLEFLKNYKKQNGFVPSVREMCKAVDLSSTSTIFYYLNIPEKQGKIKRLGLKSRAIEIVDDHDLNAQIPVVGTVAA